ncbi:hypothetical protein [Streptomyces goshikiensis]|uniref:hypothetical protein n=1 Tax=Streptomyces goshikiensis TaxID=1942 RepID=UPI0036983650
MTLSPHRKSSATHASVLTALVTGAGLGTGMIPASLRHELDLAVEIAATNLQSLLLRSAPTD